LIQFLKIPKSKIQKQENCTLLAANNVRMEAVGTVELNIEIQDLVMPHTFSILKNLTHSSILGMDFLNANNGTIYCSHGALTLHDGLVTVEMAPKTNKSTLLCLTETVTIPAHSEGLVPVRVHKNYKVQPTRICTHR
jgi:hypothetical protein